MKTPKELEEQIQIEKQKKRNAWQAARVEMIIARLNAIKTVFSISENKHEVLEWSVSRVKDLVDGIGERYISL